MKLLQRKHSKRYILNYTRNQLVRGSLRPRQPLVPELLPEDLVFGANPEDHDDRDPRHLRRPDDDEQPPDERTHDATLCQPRPGAGQTQQGADGDHDERGVARVADDGVRPVGDELVVLADGELEREVAAEGAVAEGAHDAPNEAEEGSRGEGGREPHAHRRIGRTPCEHGQDALGNGRW